MSAHPCRIEAMTSPTTIWQIKDGKRGHENQSAGLIAALARKVPIERVPVEIQTHGAGWLQACLGRYSKADPQWPHPDLIIGAGSRTHSTILAAGRARKARRIVIMAPPRLLSTQFDLCILPEHDGRSGVNILHTAGAMNPIQPRGEKDPGQGLLLIGGPSPHHDWNETELLEQIRAILQAEADTHWHLTTSRRTPATTSRALQDLDSPRLEVVPVEATGPEWLPEKLSKAARAWVSEDSVSMVYESLTSGAKVGLLRVPRKGGHSRVVRGIDRLVAQGRVLAFDSNAADLSSFPQPPPLNEAERIADIVIERFIDVPRSS